MSGSPKANGRAIVFTFVVLVAVIVAVAIVIRWLNKDRIHAAQLAAMPTLSANVKVECESAGRARTLARGDACASGSTLRLTATEPGDGTKALVVALLGPSPKVEPLAFGAPLTLPIAGDGPRELALVLASAKVDASPLREAVVADEKRAVGLQVQDTESFVSRIIEQGSFARVERYPFRVGG